MSTVSKSANPVTDRPVGEAQVRSPQCPLPKRVLRDDATTTAVKVLDLRIWAGLIVEISCTVEFFILAIETNTPADAVPAATTVATTTAGAPDKNAPAPNVMARYAANTPISCVVHPDRPFLAYSTASDAASLQVVRR
ncbi:MAG: hypothetical protein AAGD14_12665 [Planctomycetota bacterium]